MNRNKRHEKVLLTGAAGFIGSHLVERLVKEGASVRAFVHYNAFNRWDNLELMPAEIVEEVEVFPGDVQDPFVVRKAVKGCGIVYHLAALIAIPYSYIAPQSFAATNVLGTINLLEACREMGIQKFIHTSTSECYGTAQYVPIDEKHPLHGQSPYSASKIGADAVAESYYRSFGVPVSIIRPFNTYGPRQSARAIIPTIITQVLQERSLRLGNLHPTRDFNYVSDTVEALIKAAESPESVGEVINIGTGQEISIGDLAHKTMSLIGINVDIIRDGQRIRPEKSEVDRLLCDSSKARKILGWQTQVGLEEGLSKTIEWIKNHMGEFKTDVYNI